MGWLIPAAFAQGEEMGRQPGVLDMVSGSGPVVQGVLYILIGFSVASWGIIFYKYRQIHQARRESGKFTKLFWETKNLTTIHQQSDDLVHSSVAHVFRTGYQELLRMSRAKRQDNPNDPVLTTEIGSVESVERAMKRAITEETTRLEKALTFLATTASAAPFIGLFGTVWGIMNAFMGLSKTHSSSIQAVAPGIAEALIATATGLAAAIPAVMAYNYFARQIRVLSADMQNFCSEFLNIAERYFLK